MKYREFERLALEVLSARSQMKGHELYAAVARKHHKAEIEAKTFLSSLFYAPLLVLDNVKCQITCHSFYAARPELRYITELEEKGYVAHDRRQSMADAQSLRWLGVDPREVAKEGCEDDIHWITEKGREILARLTPWISLLPK
jgi:hypothetical protein